MTAKRDRRLVWDWPTRAFHWLLIVLLGLSWWSGETDNMEWHYRSGYAITGLLIFRLIWGFVGTPTARFAQFVKGPATVLAYVRSKGWNGVGHNPAGGWSVLLLLALLLAQVGFGLFAVDVDGFESGPLSYLVSFEAGRAAARWHEVTFKALQVVVAFHVIAVLFYLIVKRANLIWPMISGRRATSGDSEDIVAAPFWRLALAAVVAGALVWLIADGLRFT